MRLTLYPLARCLFLVGPAVPAVFSAVLPFAAGTAGPTKARFLAIALALGFVVTPAPAAEPVLPKHVTPAVAAAIDKGLAYLATSQASNGSWNGSKDGATYPTSMTALAAMSFLAGGNTTSRGPHHETVRRAVRYILSQAQTSGLISHRGGESGHPMYGHGFSLLLLSSVYGMETDQRIRDRIARAVVKAIDLTARAQSRLGGWTYNPGGGDEGSVTITQLQGLRAAHNAGFSVPPKVVDRAVKYLELCKTPEGGIRYSAGSGNQTRLAITAAAICCLYSAGEYDSPLAESALQYTFGRFKAMGDNYFNSGGHSYYTHLYAAQAFYQAGDEYWDEYFPVARDELLKDQKSNGSWDGDYIGPVYGTSIALTVLQLPYKFLPIYQR